MPQQRLDEDIKTNSTITVDGAYRFILDNGVVKRNVSKLDERKKEKIKSLNGNVLNKYVKKWDDLEQVMGLRGILGNSKQVNFDADLQTVKTFLTSKKQEINTCTTVQQVRGIDISFSL